MASDEVVALTLVVGLIIFFFFRYWDTLVAGLASFPPGVGTLLYNAQRD